MDRYEATVAAGLEWLFHTPQPDGALLQHHGIGLHIPDTDRSVTFVPVGWSGAPVVVLDVVNEQWVGSQGNRRLLNGLTEGELDRFALLVNELAGPEHRVFSQWNGEPGSCTGSLALAGKAHPTLEAAVKRYSAGCPTHHTVFCGWQGANDEQLACTWFQEGNAKLIRPRLPAKVG